MYRNDCYIYVMKYTSPWKCLHQRYSSHEFTGIKKKKFYYTNQLEYAYYRISPRLVL